ncbi:DUF6197 family protein [Mycobacterium avium]|uniref:DUF6197 family protein n=1 Tax=Mycobacterium avium TaxID=1764 RepID=UPI001CDB34FA|nr:hypothetical protein [Mycobacterium avium]MCA2337897.1 hypothetical protein [Mycobacterium avium]
MCEVCQGNSTAITPSVIDILKGARDILSGAKRWHQRDTWSPDRAAVCLRGACMLAAGLSHPLVVETSETRTYYEALRALQKHAETATLEEFNDAEFTVHADVLNLVDKTLADLGGLA